MIQNDVELKVTSERIAKFHAIVQNLRATVTNPESYRMCASGYLAEIDRMQLEVREYEASHPSEMKAAG